MARLLLVGNSRWHWGQRGPDGLHTWHAAPQRAGLGEDWHDLAAWAAVGPLPSDLDLPAERRLELAQVPLAQMPPWLGVDRALAGWQAWRQQGQAVLVADAGTCLSLTRVDAHGGFVGGRLSAGVALQLGCLGAATAQLPHLDAAQASSAEPLELWPIATAEAMVQGCLRACAAAIAEGWRELAGEQATGLWLTGGDGERLLPLLQQRGLDPQLAPDLCLEALDALAA